MNRTTVTIDGNEAAAYVAHKTNEVIAIYPITPSSGMGEWADQWSAEGKTNLWGIVPEVVEMQSEAGAAGALHGALQGGCLATTFTSSQGLLLMIPNMYKIAGELTPAVIHVAARALAAQGLSIFGDHQDVMAVRQTGWAMLAANSVREAMDFALIAQAATLEARVPFLHFFDGFRTSHEIAKIVQLTDEEIRSMISEDLVKRHRERALSPDHPFVRGTAQNPDVYFQAREASNPFYLAVPVIVQNVMDQFARLTDRQYRLFDYFGAPDATHVIVLMGSGAEVAQEAVEHLNRDGQKLGVIKPRLYRPFSTEHLLQALPATVEGIAVLDRTKEPGSLGEPLYMDVVTAICESLSQGRLSRTPKIIGGRYGLSSKEFTPAMVKGVFDELRKANSKNHFTVGIVDDVTHTSIEYDSAFTTEEKAATRAVFYGLGADGTVGANKNSIKIIGEETDLYAQGYFVYDSKKSGSLTVSHLRFGPHPIHSSYLISQANFVACHQFNFLEQINVLETAEPGATFLLNSPFGREEVWDHLPRTIQRELLEKKLKFFVIDGYKVARETGMGARINTIMQTCFFAIGSVLPREQAIAAIKNAIRKTYKKRGETVIQNNFAAVDKTLENLFEVKVPSTLTSNFDFRLPVPAQAPSFVRDVLGPMIQGRGDQLPVSKLPVDGTYPSGTTKWEKRNIALEIPVWDTELCIQCGKCVLVCPHAVIRAKVYDSDKLAGAPQSFASAPARWKGMSHMQYTLQVSPEDCTGCTLCVEVCPAKSKADPTHKAINMAPQLPLREREAANWEFFLGLPEAPREKLSLGQVKDVQLLAPLFEFSGACTGCGETPYIKLMSQLFGDRTIVANATGCSSIYGANLPTTPYTMNKDGRGIAWSNSLFEDNAEFGLGIRLAQDKQAEYARHLLKRSASIVGDDLVRSILEADQSTEAGISAQRERVASLKKKLSTAPAGDPHDLLAMADSLVKRAIWIVGGDGWAYDIGYGGLDHVLASGENVNILVLDSEVYSNTGGQKSKATPRAAVAKFAAAGKNTAKKDLALQAMVYGNVYVARIAMGASDMQTLKAFLEAEAYDGPSLIIAYGPCIAHGFDLSQGLTHQKLAVNSGHWPLFRYDPRRLKKGENPLQMDSQPPSIPLEQYLYSEDRYTSLKQTHPDEARHLLEEARQDTLDQWNMYQKWARTAVNPSEPKPVGVGGEIKPPAVAATGKLV
ncbi:MAG TPA: pyruvate:ferredoxin (flavodoxin) oxidoreductase [Candidatus Angelobacter sp.]|nr:pyruvate:ferredoxin (flavodoxin) oxidoreductase [Candidatus Angelobacter sp.]